MHAISTAHRILTIALIMSTVVVAPIAGSSARAPLVDESRGILSVAPMLEKVTPAVVNIAVVTQVAVEQNPMLKDPFFRRFFGLPDQIPAPETRRALAAGSGVIVDAAKGLVITNHHVINAAEYIGVTLKDGRQLKAELVGSDAATEVALLRIQAQGLTSLTLADSDLLQVGDVVLAIGNPFGVGQTVTSGIVSALGRSGLTPDNYEDFIQTDAPINPGNSGGALVNSRGDLVGMNTAIIAPSGGNVGIGFAIPANIIKAVMTQLESYGHVRRGRIGVALQPVSPEMAASVGMHQIYGAVVVSVEPNSSAAQAGLKAGDIIVEIDGKRMNSASDVRNRIGLSEAGRSLAIGCLRGGKRNDITVRLEERT